MSNKYQWMQVGKSKHDIKPVINMKQKHKRKQKYVPNILSLGRDMINLICDHLPTESIKSLRFTCKNLNKWIEFVNIHVFHCVLGLNSLPIQSNNNCFMMTIIWRKPKLHEIEKFLTSTKSHLFAVVIYNKTCRKQNDWISYQEPKLTSFHVEKKLTFTKKNKQMIWKIDTNLNENILKYMLKELKYIQFKVWKFQHNENTRLEYKSNNLILTCNGGELFSYSVDVVEKLLNWFKIKTI